MLDVWVLLADLADTLNEEAICLFHDVCLVHCCHFLAPIVLGILESILRHAHRRFARDDLHEHCTLGVYQAMFASQLRKLCAVRIVSGVAVADAVHNIGLHSGCWLATGA